LVAADTNTKPGFVEVVLVAILDIIIIANSEIILKPGSDTIRVMGILPIHIEGKLFAYMILGISAEESIRPVMANCRGWFSTRICILKNSIRTSRHYLKVSTGTYTIETVEILAYC